MSTTQISTCKHCHKAIQRTGPRPEKMPWTHAWTGLTYCSSLAALPSDEMYVTRPASTQKAPMVDLLTWTGTRASARKLEDDINAIDGGRYADVEVENVVGTYADDPGSTFARVDTISAAFDINPGESIVKIDGKWSRVTS